ncbi:hypothetical protein QCE49_27850 [Caballeronia sp. LZ008]|nr:MULTISPECIES: hypothetical protein [unclassified Caballeronia]MDR5797215.1 hypothetical protein [Caballeronia sp. LZ008]
MNAYQIVVLLFVVTMVAAIALVRGADASAKRRIEELEQQKKRINWPSTN